MRVFTTSAEHLQQVTRLLKQGEVVAIPTETVYGLAADALNVEAVEKIYEIKGRPAHNPLIIHVPTLASAKPYVEINATALKLMEAFWPGPLTLVLPKRSCIPSVVTAGLKTVGIRCPKHAAMQSILQMLDRPLAAPSANPSNYISPTQVEHVVQHLGGRLRYALDGGPCEAGVESTIIDLSNESEPQLLRPGPIPVADLESVIGAPVYLPVACHKSEEDQPKTSPGQLKVHYSPQTPLTLFSSTEEMSSYNFPPNTILLTFDQHTAQKVKLESGLEVIPLSQHNDHREVEIKLYQTLQESDRKHVSHIFVSPIPNTPEWMAVRDRLTRAAG